MEILKANFLETVTQIVVNSNTIASEHLITADQTFQHASEGLDNDATSATYRINFDETMTVSRIGLGGINWREFNAYYNGATANAFALTSTGDTTASQYTGNSATSKFLRCAPVACTSISFDVKKTIVANSEKAIGYLYVGAERIDLAASSGRLPAAKNYSPVQMTEEVAHKLSDGSTRLHKIADRWQFNVKLEHISETLRDSLRTVYNLHAGHVFVPFGTTTGWDSVIIPVVWPSPFDFFKLSDNAVGAGYEGNIKLVETVP